MHCHKCGTNLDAGTAFCPNCGEKAVLPENEQNHTAADENFSTAAPQVDAVPQTEAAPKKVLAGLSKQQLAIALVCVIAAIVLVVILLGRIFGGSSAKGVVKDYYRALEKCSAGKLLDTVPDDYLEELMDENDISKRELKKAVQEYLDDNYDDLDDIKVTFEDKKTMDEDDLAQFFFSDDLNDELDIKKGVQYDLTVRSESDHGDSVDTEEAQAVLIQYKGHWYSVDALFLVSIAAYSYC